MPQDGTPTTTDSTTTTPTGAPSASTGTGSPAGSTASTGADDRRPPWERDGRPFDAARAWTLIERLRTDLTAARSSAPATPPPAGGAPATPASPPSGTPASPATPAGPENPPIGTAPVDVELVRAELVRERVARRFGLDDALVDLLGPGDEAAITARAQVLADRIAKPESSGSPVARRPVERLRGGADPTATQEETDPVKLAAKVRR